MRLRGRPRSATTNGTMVFIANRGTLKAITEPITIPYSLQRSPKVSARVGGSGSAAPPGTAVAIPAARVVPRPPRALHAHTTLSGKKNTLRIFLFKKYSLRIREPERQ